MGFSLALITLFGLVGPFYIQRSLNYSFIIYGRLALIAGAAYLTGTIICRNIQRLQFMSILAIGLAIAVAANIAGWLAFLLFPTKQLIIYIATVFLNCMGAGLVFPIVLHRSLSRFPTMAGRAAALSGSGSLLVYTNQIKMRV